MIFPHRMPPTWLIVTLMALCGTIVSLQHTIAIPMLPSVPETYGVSTDDASWLVTSTLLVAAVATPVVTRLADMVGRRRMLVIAMSVMTAGSFVALLGTFPALIAGRSLQGFATALVPVAISILRDTLPPARIGIAIGGLSATLGIGTTLGIPLAGLLQDMAGPLTVFWVAGACGALLTVGALLIVPDIGSRSPGRFDVVGALLLSMGLAALLLALSKGGSWGWAGPRTLGCVAAAVVVFAVWAPMQWRAPNPLVNLRTAVHRPVLLTNLAGMLITFAMFINTLATTQQLQLPTWTGHGFGLTATSAGLAVATTAFAQVMVSPFAGMLIDRWNGRAVLLIGSVVTTVACAVRLVVPGTVVTVTAIAFVIAGGTAVSFATLPGLVMAAAPESESSAANGINTLLRSIGASLASATLAMILVSLSIDSGSVPVPTARAFDVVWVVAGMCALVTTVLGVLLPRRFPAHSEVTTIDACRNALAGNETTSPASSNSPVPIAARRARNLF